MPTWATSLATGALKLQLEQTITATQFHPPQGIEWEREQAASDGEALVEFAGRACYESFDQTAAKGFVQLHGLSTQISNQRDRDGGFPTGK